MKKEKMDMAKVMAVLAEPKEPPAPLKDVEQRRVEVPYIAKTHCVKVRPIRLYIPIKAQKPMPLIYIPHYEMAEDSLELRDYLGKGWMVASPADFDNAYNGQLTDDDLVFNHAALYKLKEMPEVDRDRIALVGGSAGGYMTLMLNATELGICCSIANSPIANTYFNFYQFFKTANRLNIEALTKLAGSKETDKKANTPLELMESLMNLPIPFLAAVSGMFMPILENFPEADDIARWEAFSPTALAELFCSPLMVNHFTSDILVPVDQISKQYTYERPGESLPEDFSSRMPENNPGKLGCSLEERLPRDEVRIKRLDAEKIEAQGVLPFAEDKRFNLNIFDDGPVEGFGSHRARPAVGRAVDTQYLEAMFALGAAKTNILTPQKLLFMIQHYMGRAVQLPSYENLDDEAYGSLKIYQKEVVRELREWSKNNDEGALKNVWKKAMACMDGIRWEEYEEVINEIINNI